MAPGSFVPGNRSLRLPSSSYPWKTTLLCAAALVPRILAQDVLAPPATPQNQPFKLGPLVFRPNIFYQFLYGNGIQSSPGNRQNTIVQQFSPAVVVDEGSHWTLNYTPTFNFYSSSAFRNTINQSVQLQWGTTWRDWFVTASQSYAYTDDPEIQTGGQTKQENYSTLLNAVYSINDKLSANLGFNQVFTDYGQTSSTNLTLGLSNSRSWSTMNWLNDQIWPRLTAGVGLGLGYNQQEGSPDSIYQQYQVQLNWRATDKFSFQLSGGVEEQEYLSGGESSLLTPIFGAGIQYQPFEQTRVSVTANRTVSTSAYDNENLESTSIMGDINQRLFGGLYLDLSGGFSADNYVATAVLAGANSRNDDVYSANIRLSCPFPKRGTVSIFYQYSETSSTQSGFAVGSTAFGYSSNQVGFDISYTY
jgi:hypothetical protein